VISRAREREEEEASMGFKNKLVALI
jgi:hypothetical protein